MAKTQAQTSKEFIDYRFNEIDKKLNRIEGKMDGFNFAKQSDVEKLQALYADLEGRVIKIDQKVSPMWKMYGLIFVTLVTSIIGLGFWLLQKALSK